MLLILKGGTTCLCGDEYGQISPDDECQVPCVGNNLQYCGGKNTVDGTPIYVVYTGNRWIKIPNATADLCSGLVQAIIHNIGLLSSPFRCITLGNYRKCKTEEFWNLTLRVWSQSKPSYPFHCDHLWLSQSIPRYRCTCTCGWCAVAIVCACDNYDSWLLTRIINIHLSQQAPDSYTEVNKYAYYDLYMHIWNWST